MPAVKPIPDQHPRVIPYLFMEGVREAIAFYTEVLGATQRGDATPGPDGTIGHAELSLGDSLLMLAHPDPTTGTKTPRDLGGCPVNLCVYVEDADAVFDNAIRNGATAVEPVEDRFYGDRTGTFTDPWGYTWTVMTHIEDVTPEEMERRAAEMMETA